MEFEVFPALVAGLAGTVVMSAMMGMAASMGLTKMPAMPLVMGSMVTGDRVTATRFGAVIHYLMMGTVIFGLVYAALFTALDDASVTTGAIVGVVHGLALGLIGLPMIPSVHPRVSSTPAAAGAEVITVDGGQLTISAPGLFGSKWGRMTPVGIVAGHLVFGVVVALVYTWLS
jgi:uncharacterized membrane protein YagU involved in acid resistance